MKSLSTLSAVAGVSLLIVGCGTATAQTAPEIVSVAAPAEPSAIALGTGGVAGMPPESWHRVNGDIGVRNVSRATLTPFFPKLDEVTGAAVVVAPGKDFTACPWTPKGGKWLAGLRITASPHSCSNTVHPTPRRPNRSRMRRLRYV